MVPKKERRKKPNTRTCLHQRCCTSRRRDDDVLPLPLSLHFNKDACVLNGNQPLVPLTHRGRGIMFKKDTFLHDTRYGDENWDPRWRSHQSHIRTYTRCTAVRTCLNFKTLNSFSTYRELFLDTPYFLKLLIDAKEGPSPKRMMNAAARAKNQSNE